MASRYVLAFWTKSKKTSILREETFVKSYKENGFEDPLCEGAVRVASIAGQHHAAKILRICSSRKYLESLVVNKDGSIILHGSKPPAKELLAKRSKLQDEERKHMLSDRQVLQHLFSNSEEKSTLDTLGTSFGAQPCSHACPSCCSGTLPPFPKLPDGFLSTLVSLAEYFQQFQKANEENTAVPDITTLSNQLNTWQWASPDKVELKKNSGVWIEAISLEKIMGQAQITKKPPHQTLVKSLLTHLLGLEKYIDTSAEKIDRRLLSAVVGYVNSKYPDLAQPVERYYRCINLNRGYLQKRKNEGAFDNRSDENDVGRSSSSRRMEMVRSYRKQSSEDIGAAPSEPKTKRRRRRTTASKESQLPPEMEVMNNYSGPDQVVIPLEPENLEDFPVVSSNNIIIVRRDNAVSSLPPPINPTYAEHTYFRVSDPQTKSPSPYIDFNNQNFDDDSDSVDDPMPY